MDFTLYVEIYVSSKFTLNNCFRKNKYFFAVIMVVVGFWIRRIDGEDHKYLARQMRGLNTHSERKRIWYLLGRDYKRGLYEKFKVLTHIGVDQNVARYW